MVVCQPTATPISARRRLSHWLLVSRFWPLVSSLPMETISVFMGAGVWGRARRYYTTRRTGFGERRLRKSLEVALTRIPQRSILPTTQVRSGPGQGRSLFRPVAEIGNFRRPGWQGGRVMISVIFCSRVKDNPDSNVKRLLDSAVDTRPPGGTRQDRVPHQVRRRRRRAPAREFLRQLPVRRSAPSSGRAAKAGTPCTTPRNTCSPSATRGRASA